MRHKRRQEKMHLEETKRSVGSNSDTTQMLELSDRELKITMVYIVKMLMEKVKESMQDQIDNFSWR